MYGALKEETSALKDDTEAALPFKLSDVFYFIGN
jgi:hypothetical protein